MRRNRGGRRHERTEVGNCERRPEGRLSTLKEGGAPGATRRGGPERVSGAAVNLLGFGWFGPAVDPDGDSRPRGWLESRSFSVKEKDRAAGIPPCAPIGKRPAAGAGRAARGRAASGGRCAPRGAGLDRRGFRVRRSPRLRDATRRGDMVMVAAAGDRENVDRRSPFRPTPSPKRTHRSSFGR